jgi:pimeloyl-ACP methyl ester carboxylesterase
VLVGHSYGGAVITDAAAWRTIPFWGLITMSDKVIPPRLERFEYQRAHSHIVEVDASHVAMIRHPGLVALIRDAAHATT